MLTAGVILCRLFMFVPSIYKRVFVQLQINYCSRE